MERSIYLPDLVPEIQKVLKQDTFDLFDLEDLFEVIGDAGLTTVLLMDEFEYVTQNPTEIFVKSGSKQFRYPLLKN